MNMLYVNITLHGSAIIAFKLLGKYLQQFSNVIAKKKIIERDGITCAMFRIQINSLPR